MSRILVAYATKNGSTREVAEAIAATLHDRGVAVDVHPARGIRGAVAGWNLVVVGAPIYSGRCHRDAHRFLKRHRDELRQIPVVVFGMGPRYGGRGGVAAFAFPARPRSRQAEWLAPVETAVFGGVDPAKRADQARRDLRDWDAIRAWAADIPRLA